METQTRFNLNAAIGEWQQELAGQADLTPIVRRELETHLRDTMAELQGRGLNSEESFWLARRRVGRPQQLGEEFAKTDPAKVGSDHVFWVVLVLLSISLWQSTLGASVLFFNSALHPEVVFMILYIVIRIADWLPILIGIVLAAKGRFNFAITGRLAFFNSQARVAVVGFSWIAIILILKSIAMMWTFRLATHHERIWVNLLTSAAATVLWPTMLLSLLLWLMPRRSLIISKSA